jgi:dipeptidyl aminopeptidase/acylaminoacyl peptidase
LFHADKIVDPIIVFQGADDQVVPQNQSDDIVASLRARGVTHEYHVYEGEGHGWRKPETIEAYYTSALKFLQQQVLFA